MRDARRDGSPYPKADLTLRGLARLSDLVLAFAIANTVREAGPALAALYLLVADGMQGQSVGKRIFGVRTMILPSSPGERGRPAGYRESVLRNAPFALVGLFYGLTLVGWMLLFFLGIPIIAFEAYMVASDRLGIRIGDIFADTQVVDGKVLSKREVVAQGDLRPAAPVPPGSAAGAVQRLRPAA
ncbi:MAG TPA: RDD family protein [Anaeromyxobacteraceae bacterium]|nr:RDD family protein [Anaeromyxobacteraceae bacterium]